MSGPVTIGRLAAAAGCEPEYLRRRGATEEADECAIPFGLGNTRRVVVSSTGTRYEGGGGPELFGLDEAMSREGGDLFVVSTPGSQLALGLRGLRAVAVTSQADGSAMATIPVAPSERILVVSEPHSPWLVDMVRSSVDAHSLPGAYVVTPPPGTEGLARVSRDDPGGFRLRVDRMAADAKPLAEYVAEAPGTLLSDVTPETVDWLWPNRIPLGKNTDVAGDPGTGKSLLFEADLSARVTTGGQLPDGTSVEEGGVLILNGEDDPADTLLPRIRAAGGDPSRVAVLSKVRDGPDKPERFLSLPDDTGHVWEAAHRVGAKLIVVDPFPTFLNRKLKANSDQDVRKALGVLSEAAASIGAALVTIRHLNKAAKLKAMYRASGSIGITGIARASYLVAKVPHSGDLRALVCIKMNVAREPKPLGFTVVDGGGVPRIEWVGELDVDPDDLLDPPKPRGPSKLDEAKGFVQEKLADGPALTSELIGDAERNGIARRTLDRARKVLGVETKPSGFQEPHVCRLPDPDS